MKGIEACTWAHTRTDRQPAFDNIRQSTIANDRIEITIALLHGRLSTDSRDRHWYTHKGGQPIHNILPLDKEVDPFYDADVRATSAHGQLPDKTTEPSEDDDQPGLTPEVTLIEFKGPSLSTNDPGRAPKGLIPAKRKKPMSEPE